MAFSPLKCPNPLFQRQLLPWPQRSKPNSDRHNNINGTGNALANSITGNGGNNSLNGGAGDDVLSETNEVASTQAQTTSISILDVGIVASPLAVSGYTGTISDINVRLNINHTYVQDLILTLIAPDGTRIILANRNGGNTQNFINTLFDSQASTSITAGSGPFSGSFSPIGSLSLLNGKSPNGTWILEITDASSGDVGTLQSWQLELTTSNTSNNYLNGGAGTDRMVGGFGNDTYVMDNAEDVVTENVNEGIDLVRSTIDYTLGANVENLTLVDATTTTFSTSSTPSVGVNPNSVTVGDVNRDGSLDIIAANFFPIMSRCCWGMGRAVLGR